MAAMILPGVEGMTLLEYTGRNVGSSRWGGPETGGRIYTFGDNVRDKRKLVDSRDLAWFMAKTQHGSKLFREAATVPVAEPVAEEVVAQNGGVTQEVMAEEAVEAIAVVTDAVVEEMEPIGSKSAVVLPTQREPLTVELIAESTIPEVLDMDIEGRLDEVLALETRGKGRRTLIRTLKDMIVEERLSV